MRSTRQAPATIALALLASAGAGCSAEDVGDNPSGTCGTRAAQARAGYDAPGDVTWVPDCQLTLAREYWRVYTEDGKSAFMLPRPDGAPELQAICQDPAHALHPLVDRYPVCAAATDGAQVELVNHLDLPDALALAHYLHGQLTFVPSTEGVGIAPFPIPGDILDACALAANPPELQAVCDQTLDLVQSGNSIAPHYGGAGAEQLAARLNTLYGIP